MEYIDGEPLSTRNITLKLGTKALCALQAVHDARILHWDIVPEHFIVSGDRVVLLDFDVSEIPPQDVANRLMLWREMRDCWHTLFTGLVSTLPSNKPGFVLSEDSCQISTSESRGTGSTTCGGNSTDVILLRQFHLINSSRPPVPLLTIHAIYPPLSASLQILLSTKRRCWRTLHLGQPR